MHFSWVRQSLLLATPAILSANVEAAPAEARSCKATTRTVYEFPPGTFIENLAVRSNGQILAQLLSAPETHLVDPFTSTSTLLHTYVGSEAVTGLSESAPDVWTIQSTNFTFTGGPVPGTGVGWRVDLNGVGFTGAGALNQTPAVSKISSLGPLVLPNGETAFSPEDNIVLIADSLGGILYRYNVVTGDVVPVISNANFTAGPGPQFGPFGAQGINGVHYRHPNLYFTNSGQQFFAKVRLHDNGTPAGQFKVISSDLPLGANYDDFAIKGDFAYLVTGGGNSIIRVRLNGSGKSTIIAGNLNSTAIAEPSSAAFGRTPQDCNTLYVSTAGGLQSPIIVNGVPTQIGAQIVAVDLTDCN